MTKAKYSYVGLREQIKRGDITPQEAIQTVLDNAKDKETIHGVIPGTPPSENFLRWARKRIK